MLVDDNPVNVELLGEILARPDTQVLTAYNAFPALDIARAERPNLIVLDVAMPAIDGFELFKMLRNSSETADIPVIFVTSLNDLDAQERAMEMGAADYITKPFSSEYVVGRVEQILSGGR
ncbi:MAG: response regulator [Bacteroidales bacterium]|nr:response regulator [Bacteroidales bacterium]